MKTIIAIILMLSVTGCGAYSKATKLVTDEVTETCYDHVVYIQFLSGTSVKYDTTGKIVSCKNQ